MAIRVSCGIRIVSLIWVDPLKTGKGCGMMDEISCEGGEPYD
jgi:hypothetical protein